MNYIRQQLLDDLHIHNVIPKLDQTITIFGRTKFKELFSVMYYGKNPLMRRQNLLNTIIHNPLATNMILDKLHKIKEIENSISWIFGDTSKYTGLYLNFDSGNVQELLTGHNFFKKYIPFIVLFLYIIVLILKYRKGHKVHILDFIKNMYYGYKNKLCDALKVIFTDNNLISVLVNIFVIVCVVYKLYALYNKFALSISHTRKCNEFLKKIKNIREVIDNIKYIYANDIYFNHEKKLIKPYINEIDELFDITKIKNLGYCLVLMKNIKTHEAKLNKVLEYVGLIDSFISIAKLVSINGYTLPEFNFDGAHGPLVEISGIMNIHNGNMDTTKYTMDNSNIITSNYNHHMILSIFLAQTIGVTNCQYLKFTPFTYIFVKWYYENKDIMSILNNISNDKYYIALIHKKYIITEPNKSNNILITV